MKGSAHHSGSTGHCSTELLNLQVTWPGIALVGTWKCSVSHHIISQAAHSINGFL